MNADEQILRVEDRLDQNEGWELRKLLSGQKGALLN